MDRVGPTRILNMKRDRTDVQEVTSLRKKGEEARWDSLLWRSKRSVRGRLTAEMTEEVWMSQNETVDPKGSCQEKGKIQLKKIGTFKRGACPNG